MNVGGGNVYVAGTSLVTWGTPVNPFVGGQDAFAARISDVIPSTPTPTNTPTDTAVPTSTPTNTPTNTPAVWSITNSGTTVTFNGVACPTATLCKAVGDGGTIHSWN